MPELRGLLTRSVMILDGQGAETLSDLTYISLVLELAGHHCGH